MIVSEFAITLAVTPCEFSEFYTIAPTSVQNCPSCLPLHIDALTRQFRSPYSREVCNFLIGQWESEIVGFFFGGILFDECK